MDKALDDTGPHMQMATARNAVMLGHTGHPNVNLVAVNPHNVGKIIVKTFKFSYYRLVDLSFQY